MRHYTARKGILLNHFTQKSNLNDFVWFKWGVLT